MNYSLVQLEASKPVIKDLFRDLLTEMKRFKYQIIMKGLLSKQKENDDRELTTVYFKSTTKTVTGFKDDLDDSFQEIRLKRDNWINEGSAWTIAYIDGEYINISIYNPVLGSTYIELSDKLKHPKKD